MNGQKHQSRTTIKEIAKQAKTSTATVSRVLRNSGLHRHLGEENIFPAESNPNLATRKALLRARTLVSGGDPEVRLYFDRLSPPALT